MAEKCPGCGAEIVSRYSNYITFDCLTQTFAGRIVRNGMDCLRRQLAEAKAENVQLREKMTTVRRDTLLAAAQYFDDCDAFWRSFSKGHLPNVNKVVAEQLRARAAAEAAKEKD